MRALTVPAPLPLIDTSAALCCEPLGSPSFTPAQDAPQLAARMRALSDANRIRVVQELSCCEGHELTTSACAQLLGITDATASHHLKQLEAAGLISPRRDGARVHYRLNLEATRAIGRALDVKCGAGCACM